MPDPADINAHLGRHVREVLERRTFGWTPPREGLHRLLKLGDEEQRRFFRMLPEDSQRQFIAQRMPDTDAAIRDRLIAYLRSQAEADPYALLQELPVGEDRAQNLIFKGLSLESALYLASLTGSIIHVDTQAHWEQLLRDAQPPGAPSQLAWAPVRQALGEISFPVDLDARRVAEQLNSDNPPPIRSLLRRLAVTVASPASRTAPHELAKLLRQARGKVERAEKRCAAGTLLRARLELHVPPAGFGRHEVQRLLVMFAGSTRPQPVPFALRLVFDEPSGSEDRSDQDDADAFWSAVRS